MCAKEPVMELSTTFEKIARQFAIEFGELTRETTHNLTAGEAREAALIKLLKKYLPQRVGVDRGFVIDANGGESLQIDVIVYDKSHGSIFEAAGVRYFPCETVLAIGEVKSDITSTAKLADALKKIRSVKSLDRSNGGQNKAITGPGLSTPSIARFDPSANHRDQILGFMFTQSTLARETWLEEVQAHNALHPRSLWPNLFCGFEGYLATYETEAGSLYPAPMEASTIAITDDSERQNLLLLFFCMLSTFVNEAHIARPNYFEYGSISTTHVLSYPPSVVTPPKPGD
jgi:hypothetical protein